MSTPVDFIGTLFLPELNDNNEYEYTGKTFANTNSLEERKKIKITTLLCQLIILALVIYSGFPPFEALSGTYYVILPYLFEVIFLLMQFPSLYTIFTKTKLREYEYTKSVSRLRPFYFVVGLNAAIGMAGTLVYCFMHGFQPLSLSLPYLLCKFMTAALCLYLFWFLQRLKYEEE